MLTATRSQNLRHSQTYFGSDLRLPVTDRSFEALPPALKIEKYSLARSVIRFEFNVVGDSGEVLVTKYSRSEVLNSWVKTKEDARKYWKDLVGMGYTRF